MKRKFHGKRNTRLYRIWLLMKNRCNNSMSDDYKYWGARGIKVCEAWSNDFMSFWDWSMNNGYSDCLTIDRINVNGNYEPNNCRWIKNEEQASNRRTNHLIEYKGQIKTLKEWSIEYGLNKNTLKDRLKVGWSVEKALNTTAKRGNNQFNIKM